MQNREEFKMDKIESVTSLLEGISTLQKLQQLQQNTVAERTNASSPNFGTQQDGKMENKVCHKCGKMKKFKTVATEMVTELDVIRRLKGGNPGGFQVLSQDRDEILSQAIRRRNQAPQRTTSSPLLSGKVGSGGSTEMIPCRQREQKYRPTQGVMQPTLMTFEPSGVKARPNNDRIANSRNPMISGAHQNFPRNRRRSRGSRSTSIASSSTTSSTNSSVSSTGGHRKYQRSGRRSMASSSLYSASSTDFLTRTTDYSASSSCSEELDSPPRRAMQLDRHRIYRSISRSRSSQTHWSSTSYDSSSEEEYPEKMGHVRRLTTKLAGMFRRDHHEDADASSSEEDMNARDHHLSVQKPVGNGKFHCESKGKHMPIQTRRRAKVKDKASHQQGHFRKLVKGLTSHFCGSKKSKPLSSGSRQLERALTGKKKVTAKKRHWWQNLRRRGLPNKRARLPNKRGEAHLKLGFRNKHTQLKGRHRHENDTCAFCIDSPAVAT
ncbi:hypothetical protein MKX01_019120 [Papaver californicum]|nr:hypothetical protein MKX01_019120 [Papaver californicum]